MDQTKFINSYIANLAERLKALTLDNIMLSTQLTLANETNVGLTQRIEILEHEANQPKPNGNYVGLEGNLEFGTSEEYSIAENEDVDDSTSSNNSTNKKK
jgi:hypothetical protein